MKIHGKMGVTDWLLNTLELMYSNCPVNYWTCCTWADAFSGCLTFWPQGGENDMYFRKYNNPDISLSGSLGVFIFQVELETWNSHEKTPIKNAIKNVMVDYCIMTNTQDYNRFGFIC